MPGDPRRYLPARANQLFLIGGLLAASFRNENVFLASGLSPVLRGAVIDLSMVLGVHPPPTRPGGLLDGSKLGPPAPPRGVFPELRETSSTSTTRPAAPTTEARPG